MGTINRNDFQNLYDKLPKLGESYKEYVDSYFKYSKSGKVVGRILKKTNPHLTKGDVVLFITPFETSFKFERIVVIHLSGKKIELNKTEIEDWIKQILRKQNITHLNNQMVQNFIQFFTNYQSIRNQLLIEDFSKYSEIFQQVKEITEQGFEGIHPTNPIQA